MYQIYNEFFFKSINEVVVFENKLSQNPDEYNKFVSIRNSYLNASFI